MGDRVTCLPESKTIFPKKLVLEVQLPSVKPNLLVQAGRNNPPVIEGVIYRVNSDNPNLVRRV